MEAGDYAFDLDRIFLGKLPWWYLAEVLFRSAIIYVYALLLVRLLGKRGMGQLAPFDFIIIIALGSAVGDPMFYPDVPLFHAMVAIAAIVAFTRLLVYAQQRSRKLEDFLSTTPTALVRDGVIQLKAMQEEGIARDELFEGLRDRDLEQLGQIERAYLEPSGKISVFKYPAKDIRPGLPLAPEEAETAIETRRSGDLVPVVGPYACWKCGNPQELTPGSRFEACPACGDERWMRAVKRIRDLLDDHARKAPAKAGG